MLPLRGFRSRYGVEQGFLLYGYSALQDLGLGLGLTVSTKMLPPKPKP